MKIKYCLPLFVLFISCFSENKRSKISESIDIRIDSLSKVRKSITEGLISDHACIIGWDTSNLFTYELKEILDSSSNILLSGDIVDIIKSDSVYYLYIHHQGSSRKCDYEFIAKVKVSELQWKSEKYNSKSDSLSGYFVVNVNNVKSIPIKIFADGEYDSEDVSSFINVSISEKLIFISGELVTFVPRPKKNF
ncbi:MAG: hypothetical protein WAT79_13345 [Saprospiraceae bacterium]